MLWSKSHAWSFDGWAEVKHNCAQAHCPLPSHFIHDQFFSTQGGCVHSGYSGPARFMVPLCAYRLILHGIPQFYLTLHSMTKPYSLDLRDKTETSHLNITDKMWFIVIFTRQLKCWGCGQRSNTGSKSLALQAVNSATPWFSSYLAPFMVPEHIQELVLGMESRLALDHFQVWIFFF